MFIDSSLSLWESFVFSGALLEAAQRKSKKNLSFTLHLQDHQCAELFLRLMEKFSPRVRQLHVKSRTSCWSVARLEYPHASVDT